MSHSLVRRRPGACVVVAAAAESSRVAVVAARRAGPENQGSSRLRRDMAGAPSASKWVVGHVGTTTSPRSGRKGEQNTMRPPPRTRPSGRAQTQSCRAAGPRRGAVRFVDGARSTEEYVPRLPSSRAGHNSWEGIHAGRRENVTGLSLQHRGPLRTTLRAELSCHGERRERPFGDPDLENDIHPVRDPLDGESPWWPSVSTWPTASPMLLDLGGSVGRWCKRPWMVPVRADVTLHPVSDAPSSSWGRPHGTDRPPTARRGGGGRFGASQGAGLG